MDLKQISDKALEIRQKYHQFELKKVGHSWTNREIMEGFVGDVGSLMKIIMVKEGSRQDVSDVDTSLKHEICDCLWCILVLARKYDIDLEKEFMEKMDELNERIEKEL